MKSSTHGLIAVATLVLLLALSYFLDGYALAGAARSSEFMDSSWAWAKIISRLTLATLLLGCAAFVLSPPTPLRIVALLYLLTGIVLTFMAIPAIAARISAGGVASVQWIIFQSSGIALPTTAAFLTVIGAAALFRRYLPVRHAKA